jgi:hypothetical protein
LSERTLAQHPNSRPSPAEQRNSYASEIIVKQEWMGKLPTYSCFLDLLCN